MSTMFCEWVNSASTMKNPHPLLFYIIFLCTEVILGETGNFFLMPTIHLYIVKTWLEPPALLQA